MITPACPACLPFLVLFHYYLQTPYLSLPSVLKVHCTHQGLSTEASMAILLSVASSHCSYESYWKNFYKLTIEEGAFVFSHCSSDTSFLIILVYIKNLLILLMLHAVILDFSQHIWILLRIPLFVYLTTFQKLTKTSKTCYLFANPQLLNFLAE